MSDVGRAPSDGLLLVVNYDQALEIGSFLENVKEYFSPEHCIVVDDGSKDDSPEIAENAGFKVIRHERNRGVGAAIRTGLHYGRDAGYRWVLITASNGKMLPRDFERVYGPVQRGIADYVQGNRFLKSGSSPGLPLFRRMMIPLFSLFASVLLGRRFGDITCGLRCYTFDLLRAPEIDLEQEWLDRYELEYYLHYKAVRLKRYRIVEVPVTMRYELLAPNRQSKIQPIVGWWSMIRPFLLLAFRIRK